MNKNNEIINNNRRQRLIKALSVCEPLVLILCPAVLIICAVLKIENIILLITLVALISFIPFVIRFELKRPTPADIMPIVVLSAAAIVGRLAFIALPNVQPVTAIVIFTGIFFGRQSGFMTGAFTAIVSNMALGQGIWTPWQMYAWGLIGFLAGVLFSRFTDDKNSKYLLEDIYPLIYIFGAISAALFSIIMDVWFVIGFLRDLSISAILAAFGAGLLLNLLHVIGTVIILILMIQPWGRKIERINRKYGREKLQRL